MTYKIAFLGLFVLAGCVAPAPQNASLVRISVEATKGTSFERLLASAQPLADQACAAKQMRAQWMVATKVSDTQTKLAFACQ